MENKDIDWKKVVRIVDGITTGILKSFLAVFGLIFLFMFDTHRPRRHYWWW